VRRGMSIVDSCYAVGYGSSRALYERAGRRLGMTPGEYLRGADGISIEYLIVSASVGAVLLAHTEAGICAVLVGNDDAALEAQLRAEFPASTLTREPVVPVALLRAVQSCERWDPLVDALPLEHRIGIFQARVWKNLGGRSG
jgi:AraC family transcriptional regulator of adaptative response/methylated-DNA-[protein]-cysteine methyltransferase